MNGRMGVQTNKRPGRQVCHHSPVVPGLPTGLESARAPYYLRTACRIRFTGDRLMAVSKRLRFEVLRRDGFCCRYCGEHASEQVKLTVDHVLPTALGGDDQAENLAAACGPCNSGKSATSPDAPLVAQVSQDAIRYSRAMATAGQMAQRDLQENEKYCEYAWDAWVSRFGIGSDPDDSYTTFSMFRSNGMPLDVLENAMAITERNGVPTHRAWKYCMGVAWKKLREIQNTARVIYEVNSGS